MSVSPPTIEPASVPAIFGTVEPAPISGSAMVGLLKSLDDTPGGPTASVSSLPANFHEAYRLKLAGHSPDEIGKQFGVCRQTVWRWCKQVEDEYRASIESTPVLNQIGEALARLDDLSKQARESALNAKAGREKALFLSEARRCEKDKTQLLVTVGVLPKQPERLYQVTADLRPASLDGSSENPMNRSREEIIAQLIQKLTKSQTIT